ncbi:unnamed protein product [Rhodiola kirilowii]
MAAAMAAISSLQLTSSFLAKPSLSTFSRSRHSSALLPIRRIAAEFNISFAPSKPKKSPSSPRPPPTSESDTDSSPSVPKFGPSDLDSGPFFIPWIVRDEKGNLSMESRPPARYLAALAETKPTPKKNKSGKVVQRSAPKAKVSVPTAEPRYSKAARRYYNENFRTPPQRLSKVLAAAGVASRRSSEELIFEGRVTVNGKPCNTPQTKVDPGRDIIYVNGNRLPKKLPPKVYFALNKPKGYICSFGENETKSVICLFEDYLKSWDKRNPGQPKPRLFTVGRLDVATTGLIIVTNDGDFAQALSHPSSNLSKEYIATIDGTVSKKQLISLSEGTVVEGVHCTPDYVELLPKQPDLSRARLRVVVHEGRNHEVRELVKNAGLTLHSLKRTRIGAYRLPSDLGLGTHAELKQSDLKALGWLGRVKEAAE